jgi:hypothetical protein
MRFAVEARLYMPRINVAKFRNAVNQAVAGKVQVDGSFGPPREQTDGGRNPTGPYWHWEGAFIAQAEAQAVMDAISAEAVDQGAVPPSQIRLGWVLEGESEPTILLWQAQ